MIKSQISWIRCKFGTPLQFCTVLRRAYQKHTIAFVTGTTVTVWTTESKWKKWNHRWASLSPYGSPRAFSTFVESIDYD